jgi:hypothetical protein
MTPSQVPFTDEELRVLELMAKDKKIKSIRISTQSTQALVNRTRAAEKFVETSNVPNCNCDGECEVHKPLLLAWLRSKGG